LMIGLVSPVASTRSPRATFGWAGLSPSRLGIAELVARGLTNGEIAARLYWSRHTPSTSISGRSSRS
jgi:DNA-binding NarL/FixJ family response regulator